MSSRSRQNRRDTRTDKLSASAAAVEKGLRKNAAADDLIQECKCCVIPLFFSLTESAIDS